MLVPYTFRSGWIELGPSRIDPFGPLVLFFCEHRTVRKDIHVPLKYRGKYGELLAIVVRMGERLSIAEGVIQAHDEGIRMLSLTDPRASTFKVRLIRSLERDLVELWFIPEKKNDGQA